MMPFRLTVLSATCGILGAFLAAALPAVPKRWARSASTGWATIFWWTR